MDRSAMIKTLLEKCPAKRSVEPAPVDEELRYQNRVEFQTAEPASVIPEK